MWYNFTFTSGANPYICINLKSAVENIKHYKRKGYKVEKQENGFYLVHDKRKEGNE